MLGPQGADRYSLTRLYDSVASLMSEPASDGLLITATRADSDPTLVRLRVNLGQRNTVSKSTRRLRVDPIRDLIGYSIAPRRLIISTHVGPRPIYTIIRVSWSYMMMSRESTSGGLLRHVRTESDWRKCDYGWRSLFRRGGGGGVSIRYAIWLAIAGPCSVGWK